MDATYEAIFSGSSATVYENGIAAKSFYFRFAIFSKEKKNVLIPSYLYDTKDAWNSMALTLTNAMIDRTSGGYWMSQLNAYGKSDKCTIVENAATSEEEKNTLRVMVALMNQDSLNSGMADGFVTEYLRRPPASEMPAAQLEELYNGQCYLTII